MNKRVLTRLWPATSTEKAHGISDRVIQYQYRHDRARRALRGIDEEVAKPNAPLRATPRSSATTTFRSRVRRTARRYPTVTIQASRQTLTAAEPVRDDLAEMLAKIHSGGVH